MVIAWQIGLRLTASAIGRLKSMSSEQAQTIYPVWMHGLKIHVQLKCIDSGTWGIMTTNQWQ